MTNNDFVARIHLKPGETKEQAQQVRPDVLRYCLSNPKEQYLVIGWSCVHTPDNCFTGFEDFYDAARKQGEAEATKKKKKYRIDSALNLFLEAGQNDLFWTRDSSGFYWICRAKGAAEPYCIKDYDIGARLPVYAFRYGTDVPGQIKAMFTRARGGIVERNREKIMIEFSKHAYNVASKSHFYTVDKSSQGQDVIDRLPDFDLEELVISYIQVRYNMYVLSNSIANKSTTPLIECILHSRELGNSQRAVVQVKGKDGIINVKDYDGFLSSGFTVFLFSSSKNYDNEIEHESIHYIERRDLLSFYAEYRNNLPESIIRWEDLFA